MNHTNEEVERVAKEIDRLISPHINGLVSYGACLNAVSKYHLDKMSEVKSNLNLCDLLAKNYSDQVASLQSENQRLREDLENVEWAAVRRVGGYTVPACPCCYGGNPSAKKSLTEQTGEDWKRACPVTEEYANEKLGHRKDCSLNAALKPE